MGRRLFRGTTQFGQKAQTHYRHIKPAALTVQLRPAPTYRHRRSKVIQNALALLLFTASEALFEGSSRHVFVIAFHVILLRLS